ncbi:transketolase [Rhodobacteraceae bacterium HSP-20]|uniref:Transketolase n=1 Tax=Paragemmobacter amnigenus TaxID=2852097 RepID=A0ABS6J4P9_9RHOB|nr:transketolase [Rhodobacter amnigenus]MBU9698734.1 transketolase [Rhodobacter amnigenus]MBV4389961.1 transketolase [Rhodobacter amnigenus]
MRDLPQASHADMANAIRFMAADAVEKAASGHPGMPMGMADVATVLFSRFLKFDAARPDWPDRDRFVLSAGHGSMLLYSVLHLAGYPGWDIGTLRDFRQLGSPAAGHPEYGHGAGIETTTGPLGQGIATAVGMALAEEMDRARFGVDVVDHHTWVIAGDGCLMEGVSQEAISLAGHLRLSRLIVLWDDNGITIDGGTAAATSEDQRKRFEASGWQTLACDGHDPESIAAAMAMAKRATRPVMIACRTVIGKGAPAKAGTAKCHGSPLGGEEIAGARAALGWAHGPFEVPEEVRAAWAAAGARGVALRLDWEARLAASSRRGAFLAHHEGRLPDGWREALAAHRAGLSEAGKAMATRKASGAALEVLTARVPALIGGSADLTGSVNTLTKATAPLTAQDFAGRYIHYGVREHGMAAVMNGMALHGGYRPYAGTFLVFADYLHPALRLSCLMGLPVTYVLTHDSIGLGEDGPTHQPVETLAMLRATPGLVTLRPADAVEAAEAWEIALDRAKGPTAIVLSRQDLPVLRADGGVGNASARGGYVLAEAECGPRKVTIVATGSEVSLAVEARAALEARGIGAAVVSLPSFELFRAQDAAYRAAVLGQGVRIGVEAALRFGWDEVIGAEGGFVGMTGFGASAPAEVLYRHFGITAEAVVALAVERLGHDA